MSNSSLTLLESYFADNKQRVRHRNNVSSDCKDVARVCPQQSVVRNNQCMQMTIKFYSSNETIEDSAKVLGWIALNKVVYLSK